MTTHILTIAALAAAALSAIGYALIGEWVTAFWAGIAALWILVCIGEE